MSMDFYQICVCIDIVEIWFGIANVQVLSIFDKVRYCDMIMVGYFYFTFLFSFVFIVIYVFI